MNKTVHINLANLSFYINEDAYIKLQAYLDAVKHSFKNTEGSDEILMDIEARIAELFSEKFQNERQVITLKEVEAIIVIMGQPEDYILDEATYEDNSISSKTISKKLYRDIENQYIAGVSSGLGHYIGIDPLWIRLTWVLLVFAGFGTPILMYILLWILVPEATTIAQKIAMNGEPVNISNIEKKQDSSDDKSESPVFVEPPSPQKTDKVANNNMKEVCWLAESLTCL